MTYVCMIKGIYLSSRVSALHAESREFDPSNLHSVHCSLDGATCVDHEVDARNTVIMCRKEGKKNN